MAKRASRSVHFILARMSRSKAGRCSAAGQRLETAEARTVEREASRPTVFPERELALDRTLAKVLLGRKPADDAMRRKVAGE